MQRETCRNWQFNYMTLFIPKVNLLAEPHPYSMWRLSWQCHKLAARHKQLSNGRLDILQYLSLLLWFGSRSFCSVGENTICCCVGRRWNQNLASPWLSALVDNVKKNSKKQTKPRQTENLIARNKECGFRDCLLFITRFDWCCYFLSPLGKYDAMILHCCCWPLAKSPCLCESGAAPLCRQVWLGGFSRPHQHTHRTLHFRPPNLLQHR